MEENQKENPVSGTADNTDFNFKNKISNVITSFVYYNSLLRDTLEYCVNKKVYNVDAYKYRQNGIIKELEIDSALHTFLLNNGENGQKLLDRLIDFGQLVYGEDSTILHLADDGLRVDAAQHITIIENVVTLHEEISSIIKVHTDYAAKQNLLEPEIVDLLKKDEAYYRGVVLFTILNELEFQFGEYNKARRDAKGEKTAASNFIEQDISKLIGLYNFSRQHATITEESYTKVLDLENSIIEMTSGRRDLPAGKTFKDEFEACRAASIEFISKNEMPWRAIFMTCIKSLVNEINANKANNPTPAEPVVQPKKVEPKPVEESSKGIGAKLRAKADALQKELDEGKKN
jgi:hypothetical protein